MCSTRDRLVLANRIPVHFNGINWAALMGVAFGERWLLGNEDTRLSRDTESGVIVGNRRAGVETCVVDWDEFRACGGFKNFRGEFTFGCSPFL